jgi:hypothetical protein
VLTFYDVGAVVYHLRLVAWQIPDFDPERYDVALRRSHQRIGAEGALDVHAHRFLIIAERPRRVPEMSPDHHQQRTNAAKGNV